MQPLKPLSCTQKRMLPPSKQQEKSHDQCGFEDITNLQATKMTQSVSLMHTEGPWAVDEPRNKSGRQVRSSRSSGLSRASSVFSVHPTLILEPWRLLLASQEAAPAARKWVEPPWWRGLGCGNGDHLKLAARVWCYGFGPGTALTAQDYAVMLVPHLFKQSNTV